MKLSPTKLLKLQFNPDAICSYLIIYDKGKTGIQMINTDTEEGFDNVGSYEEIFLPITKIAPQSQYMYGCLQALTAVHNVGREKLKRFMLITVDCLEGFGIPTNVHGWVNFDTLDEMSAYINKHKLLIPQVWKHFGD